MALATELTSAGQKDPEKPEVEMFASRKSAASTLVSLAILTLAFLGIQNGTASADTHWSSTTDITQGPTDCPQDTHWSADTQTCVEDTHW